MVSSRPQPLALAHCFLHKPHTLHSCPIFGQIFVGSFLRAMVLCTGAPPSWNSLNTSIVSPAAPLSPVRWNLPSSKYLDSYAFIVGGVLCILYIYFQSLTPPFLLWLYRLLAFLTLYMYIVLCKTEMFISFICNLILFYLVLYTGLFIYIVFSTWRERAPFLAAW